MVEDKIKELIIEDSFFIVGRGRVFSIDFKKNNIEGTREDIFNLLFNQKVLINNTVYIVRGIELFAYEKIHTKGRLLVREMENK